MQAFATSICGYRAYGINRFANSYFGISHLYFVPVPLLLATAYY